MGQPVRLKARGRPYRTFQTSVRRIAPVAEATNNAKSQQAPSRTISKAVIVYCPMENDTARLWPGMTGYARIYTGRCSLGECTVNRILRYVRTEFWW